MPEKSFNLAIKMMDIKFKQTNKQMTTKIIQNKIMDIYDPG